MRILFKILIVFILVVSTGFVVFATTKTDLEQYGEAPQGTRIDLSGEPRDFARSYQTVSDLPDSYELVADNGSLKLYLDRYFMSIIVENDNGYRWFSAPADLPESVQPYSKYWYYLKSGLSMDIINVRQSYSRLELKGTDSSLSADLDYVLTDKGFVAGVHFPHMNLRFDVVVEIENNTLLVSIPHDRMAEGPTTSNDSLGRITVFPFFGATTIEKSSGYAFIPDGSGALIHYNEIPVKDYYQKDIYGIDYGIYDYSQLKENIVRPHTVSLPVFGMVHGEGLDGVVVDLVDGAAHARISSFLRSDTVPFNHTYFQMGYRDVYAQPVSANGDSVSLKTKGLYPVDYAARYTFLKDEDATYAGFARTYRSYVLNQERKTEGNPSLQVDMIGIDSKPALFGETTVLMTSLDDMKDIYETLEEHGVRVHANALSWNKGGFKSNLETFAFDRNMGSKDDVKNFMTWAESKDMSLQFDMISLPDNAFSNSSYKMNSTLIELPFGDGERVPLFHPKRLNETSSTIKDMVSSLESVSFYGVGRTAYSYKDRGEYHRPEDMIAYYRSFLSAFDGHEIGMDKPNAYMLDVVDRYYRTPLSASGYMYQSASVPFLQMVLSGHVTMYSDYLNFVSDIDLYTLRLIEYDVYPAFIATKEDTIAMRYGYYNHLYSTTFDLWKQDMVDVHDRIDAGLKGVSQAIMIDHYQIEKNVFASLYDNGIRIYVNYGEEPVTHDNVTIEGESYAIG